MGRNAISTIEQQEGVVLPKLTREVGTMLDTEKLMEKVKKEGREEGREEGKIEAASGIIRKFMRLGMRFEKAFSKAQEAIHLSDSSVKYLKEKFS